MYLEFCYELTTPIPILGAASDISCGLFTVCWEPIIVVVVYRLSEHTILSNMHSFFPTWQLVCDGTCCTVSFSFSIIKYESLTYMGVHGLSLFPVLKKTTFPVKEMADSHLLCDR